MKLILKILLIILFLLIVPLNFSYAIDGNNARTMEEIREELRTRIAEAEASKEAAKEKLQELKTGQTTGIKVKLTEQRKKNITKFFNNMVNKLENAVLRLTKITERIETRLSKMKANGKDTASLETKVTAVKTDIEKIKTEIVTARDSLTAILSSGTPKEEFFKVKETVKTIWTEIKDIHQNLVEIITKMKGMSKGSEIKPTEASEE